MSASSFINLHYPFLVAYRVVLYHTARQLAGSQSSEILATVRKQLQSTGMINDSKVLTLKGLRHEAKIISQLGPTRVESFIHRFQELKLQKSL